MLDYFRAVPKKRSVKLHKNKSGILFFNPHWIFKIIFSGFSGLVILSVLYLIYLFEPLGLAIARYQYNNLSNKQLAKVKIGSTPTIKPLFVDNPSVGSEQVGSTSSPQVARDNFDISIPKIGAISQVAKSVDTQSKEEYLKVLSSGKLAQALGSALPGDGMGKSIYIFAHSSEQNIVSLRNNAVFYLLDLLKNKDQILVNYQDKNYVYEVVDRKIANPKDVEFLNYSDPSSETLILQTCWPIGTNWKRLLVFAKKV